MKIVIKILILVSIFFSQINDGYTQSNYCPQCYDTANSSYDFWNSWLNSEMSGYYWQTMSGLISNWIGFLNGGTSWLDPYAIFFNGWENPWDYINSVQNSYYNGWGQTTDDLNYCLSLYIC